MHEMLSLVRSSLLLLAPIGIVVVLLAARWSTAPLGRGRRAASLAVRCLIVLLLTLALGGPVWTRIADLPRCTIFLADVSESIPAGSLDKSLADLKPLWDREVAAGHRCALVAFAGTARIVVPPGTRPLEVASIPADDALRRRSTDFARAFELARSLYQDHAANRIVLLSDGLDSTAPAARVDVPAGTVGIPPVAPPTGDVAVVDVQVPIAVRSGEPFEIRVTVATDRAAEFGLSVDMDGTALPEQSRRFSVSGPGRHTVVLPTLQRNSSFPAGLHKLLVIAGTKGDREPRNNVGLAAVTVTGKPKVLLVEGSARDGEFLARLLQAQDIEFVRQSPAEFAPRAGSLDEFVAVVLAGVPRESLPSAAVASLKTFVEQTGGGLWIVGAPALVGARGYAGSDLEKLLPVSFSDPITPIADPAPKTDPPPAAPPPPPPAPPDPADAKPAKVLAPSIAMLLLIDKSGSMAGRNIEIAKESCIATAKALSRRDLVGVIAFNHEARPLLEFTEAERIDYITQRILRLIADGGTQIYPPLALAAKMFQLDGRAQACSIKHVVLLSDGDAPPADYEPLIAHMVESGITVSTVCVSAAKFDPNLMSRLASWGKGKFHFAPSFDQVPQLIAQETQRVIASLPKDDKEKTPPPPAPAPKTPTPPPPVAPLPPPPTAEKPPPLLPVVLKDAHEILAGIDGKSLPGLRGRLAATAKPKADVPLATKEGQAVLALGRLGLGKTAVWASDLSGPWSSDWMTWKDSPKLFAQLVRFVSGSGPDAELASRVRLSRDGADLLLHVDPAGQGGAISVADASGAVLPLQRDADAEGLIRVPLEKPGELRRLFLQRADGKKLALGAIRAYEEEFAPRESARDLYAAGLPAVTAEQLDRLLGETRVTGEERRDLMPWVVVAALLLLPLDVALRRLMTA